MNLEELRRLLSYNKELAEEYRKIIASASPGSLVTQTNRSGTQSTYLRTYSHLNGDCVCTRVPVSEELKPLADSIKYAHFCMKCLEWLEADIAALEYFLKKYKGYSPEKIFPLMRKSYQDLDFSIYKPIEYRDWRGSNHSQGTNYLWEKMEERQNKSFPEGLKHEGPGGKFRSKSEILIATQLVRYGVEFKYEPAVMLGDRTVYPDFAILKPKTNQIIYWEHAGMLDELEYAENLGNKLREYSAHNINMGQNIILTTESIDCPISVMHIEDLINFHFLQ